MSKPLENIKVLDLTRVLAGPFCTMILNDLGAYILKVEVPETGDDARAFGPFKNEQSLYFVSINRGKESISLNLKSKKGKKILLDLVQRQAAEHECSHDVVQVVAGEHDVAGLPCGIGAGADRNSNIGGCQCGRVVDSVANHRGELAGLLVALDQRNLVGRHQLRVELVDSHAGSDRLCDFGVVAGNHHGANAHAV